MKDFNEEFNKIPDYVPSEGFTGGFYEHKPGKYGGIIGNVEFKFKNIEGNKCSPSEPDAIWTGTLLKIICISSGEKILINNKFEYTENVESPYQLYYNYFLTANPKFQWQHISKFNNFVLPDGTRLVEMDKTTGKNAFNHKNLVKFIGLPVFFELKTGQKSGKTYLDNIELGDTAKRINPKYLDLLNEGIQDYIEKNKAKSKVEIEFESPNTNIDQLFQDNINNPEGYVQF